MTRVVNSTMNRVLRAWEVGSQQSGEGRGPNKANFRRIEDLRSVGVAWRAQMAALYQQVPHKLGTAAADTKSTQQLTRTSHPPDDQRCSVFVGRLVVVLEVPAWQHVQGCGDRHRKSVYMVCTPHVSQQS